MSSFNDKEYIKLLESLIDQQYDDTIDDYDIEKMEWIPSEPEKKVHNYSTTGQLDLTNVKYNNIKDEILKCVNLKVGKFKIRISKYNGVPDQLGPQITINMKVWEEHFEKSNGSRMDRTIKFDTDSRFSNRPWIMYFDKRNYLSKVPIDTAVDIVRWLQAITRMTAFI